MPVFLGRREERSGAYVVVSVASTTVPNTEIRAKINPILMDSYLQDTKQENDSSNRMSFPA